MLVDSENLVSMTEANQNFSRVARRVEERGPVVVLRNNQPAYLVSKFPGAAADSQTPRFTWATNSQVHAIADELLADFDETWRELAK